MSDLAGRRADTSRRWFQAGQRAAADQFEARLSKRRAETARTEAAIRQGREQAHAGWLAGELIPYRITMYLDARGLEGPDVDERCLAREPQVDLWEAGRLYPSWEQLLALAELVEAPPRAFFVQLGDPAPLRWQDTTLRHHVPDERPCPAPTDQLDLFAEPQVDDGPVLRFTREALVEAAARYGVTAPPAELRVLGGDR